MGEDPGADTYKGRAPLGIRAVYIRRRIGRRRSFFRKHRVLMLFLAGAGACLFAFLFTREARNPAATAPFRAPAPTGAPELTQRFPPAKYQRVIYRYSVIPGGVRSQEELSASVDNDRVVAAHYAGFQISHARMIRAEETKFVHVSYRMRDKVFWTAATVKLPKGETLITDGREVARARCGNKVSAVALEPVSEEEPAIETFDVPLVAGPETPEPKSISELVVEPGEFVPLEPSIPIQYPVIEHPTIQYPTIPPFYYPPEIVVSPPSDDIIVPEPGALGLLTSGLITLLVVGLTRKRRLFGQVPSAK